MNTLNFIWSVIVAKSKTVWSFFLKWFTPVVEEAKDIAKTVNKDQKPKTKIKLRKKIKKSVKSKK